MSQIPAEKKHGGRGQPAAPQVTPGGEALRAVSVLAFRWPDDVVLVVLLDAEPPGPERPTRGWIPTEAQDGVVGGEIVSPSSA